MNEALEQLIKTLHEATKALEWLVEEVKEKESQIKELENFKKVIKGE